MHKHRIALEGGELLVKPQNKHGDPFTKGVKIFICDKCKRVWQYEPIQNHKMKKYTYLGDWFPKLQMTKNCPECGV